MRILFLISTLLFISFCSFSQNKHKIDSLKSAYQTATHDTSRISALLGLFLEYYLAKPDTAFVFCEKALFIAEKANLKGQMAECYGNLAYLVQQRGDFSKALEYNYKCAGFFEESLTEKELSENMDKETFLSLSVEQAGIEKNLKNALAAVYNNIGVIYEQQGEIDKALEHHFLSLKLQEAIKNKDGMATSYNNIGVIYYEQKENDNALEYCFLSLKTYEEVKDKQGMAYSYNNIGAIYDNQGKIDKALKYYFLSLNIREKIKDKRGMAESYHNIGDVLCALDRLEEGMRYLKLGLAMSKELGYKARISDDYSAIGALQLKGGQLEVALENGLEALAVAKEIGHVDYMRRAAKLLSTTYRKQSKFEDALAMYGLQIQMRDSIVNEENTKATIRQQMKYEYEKEQILAEQARKEELRIQEEELKRRNSLHYSAIFIGLLVLFGGVMALGFIKVP
ncbi:MAG: tetratricopeptide repeat protein, partial [Bacteroidia bacterium]|nr:tetratricopeptide repeat protein [Bacteroidia bacterium]